MAHILLAEDDGSMCKFLTLALERAGHTVTARNDGLQAMEALENLEKTSDTPYDLLLTDIVMPGMDGVELAQQAKKKCPHMKIMFITGFAAVALDQKKSPDENTKVLSKPFHLKDLVSQVEALLNAA